MHLLFASAWHEVLALADLEAFAAAPFAEITRGDDRASQVPGGTPLDLCRAQIPRPGLRFLPYRSLGAAPALVRDESPSDMHSFGAVSARPQPLLSTLRSTPPLRLCRTTQDSLLGWWLTFAGQD